MSTSSLIKTNIYIPTALRKLTDGDASVKVEGATVGDALEDLATHFPSLRKHLYTDEGTLRSFVNVYVNDEDIRYLDKEATLLSEQDSLSIVPSIAGGRV